MRNAKERERERERERESNDSTNQDVWVHPPLLWSGMFKK